MLLCFTFVYYTNYESFLFTYIHIQSQNGFVQQLNTTQDDVGHCCIGARLHRKKTAANTSTAFAEFLPPHREPSTSNLYWPSGMTPQVSTHTACRVQALRVMISKGLIEQRRRQDAVSSPADTLNKTFKSQEMAPQPARHEWSARISKHQAKQLTESTVG